MNGHVLGDGSLLPPCGSWELDSGGHAYHKALFPAEPPPQLTLLESSGRTVIEIRDNEGSFVFTLGERRVKGEQLGQFLAELPAGAVQKRAVR